jgi:hypothetical protein
MISSAPGGWAVPAFWLKIWFQSVPWFWRFSKITTFSTNQKPWQPYLILGKVTRHKFGRGAFKKYHIKVWSNLTQWLLKRSKCEKLTDDKQQTQSDGKSSFQPWWTKYFFENYQLLPCFDTIGPVVSGKKLKFRSLRMTEGWTSSDDNTSQPLKVSSSFKHTLIMKNTTKTKV